MISKRTFKGKFKTPDTENWYYGTLTYDPDKGAELEIFGTFNHKFWDQSSRQIIIGQTDEGDITLINNWYRRTRSSKNNIVVGVYRPNIIIDGHIFKEISNINFEEVTFRVFNLFPWISKTGQNRNDIDYYNLGKYSIHYEEIPSIDFKLNNHCTGKISFEAPIDFGAIQNEIKIYEEAYVTFNYSYHKNIADILKDIAAFFNSITLFTNEQSYPTSILFRDSKFLEEKSKVQQRKYINCIYKNTFYDSKHKVRRSGEFLVEYSEIEGNYSTIINKWFELYEEMDSVMMLMMKYYKNKYEFSSDQFMDIIRAIENFHRIDHKNERISQGKFENLVTTILKQVDLEEEDLEWLTGRLKGNEPTLKNRLKDLIQESDTDLINEKVGKINSFCWKVTTSRNYYTHYDKNRKEEAAKSSDLLELTRTLRAILISNILKKIDVPVKSYENGLKYHLG
jgi:hypothetical protein